MKLSRAKIQTLHQTILNCGNVVVPVHMGHAMAVNQQAAEPVAEFIRVYAFAPPTEKALAMQAEHTDLLEKHRVPGLDKVKVKNNAAFLKAKQALMKKHAAVVKEQETQQNKLKIILAEEVEIELMMVSASILPNLPAGAISGLMPMIQW